MSEHPTYPGDIPNSRGMIRPLALADAQPVQMDGVKGVSMAVMLGRAHGMPHFAIRQFIVEPGGHSPHHSHDYEHEVYIVAGSGTVTLGGREHPVRAGDVVYVPADEMHQFRASGKGPGNAPGGMTFLCMVPVDRNCGDPTPGS